MKELMRSVCEHMCFGKTFWTDEDTGAMRPLETLCYPGNEYDIDLDSDIALSFRLKPEQRQKARQYQSERSSARKKEIKDMKTEGFATIYDFRRYKKMVKEDEDAALNMKQSTLGIEKTVEVASK